MVNAGNSLFYLAFTNPVPGPKYATTNVLVGVALVGSVAATLYVYLSTDGVNNNAGYFGLAVPDTNLYAVSWWASVNSTNNYDYFKVDSTAGITTTYIDALSWKFQR